METTIVYWGYIGIMEKKMETTIYYTKSGRDYLLILELSLLWWIVAGGQPGFCKDNKRAVQL